MDRRHLRAQDRVMLSHLLRKGDFPDGRGLNGPLRIAHFSYPEGGEKGADTDSRGA